MNSTNPVVANAISCRTVVRNDAGVDKEIRDFISECKNAEKILMSLPAATSALTTKVKDVGDKFKDSLESVRSISEFDNNPMKKQALDALTRVRAAREKAAGSLEILYKLVAFSLTSPFS